MAQPPPRVSALRHEWTADRWIDLAFLRCPVACTDYSHRRQLWGRVFGLSRLCAGRGAADRAFGQRRPANDRAAQKTIERARELANQAALQLRLVFSRRFLGAEESQNRGQRPREAVGQRLHQPARRHAEFEKVHDALFRGAQPQQAESSAGDSASFRGGDPAIRRGIRPEAGQDRPARRRRDERRASRFAASRRAPAPTTIC